MFLRFQGYGRIGSIALFTLLACSETAPNTSTGTGGGGSGAAGTPSAGGSTSGASSGGAGSSAGGSAAGMTAAGSAGTLQSGAGAGGASGGGAGGGAGGEKSKTTFFVSSDTSKTGKLGGLDGADARCNTLAAAAGFGDHTFHAWLSTSTVNAKDRIGTGPWVNSKGMMLAADVTALLAMTGNADLFIDEKGMKINGQWADSPDPNEHDILTGTKADGTVSTGKTCMDWTSDSGDDAKTVGHSDGLGPDMDMSGTRPSWTAAHDTDGCDDTAPGGGAGRIYCFAID